MPVTVGDRSIIAPREFRRGARDTTDNNISDLTGSVATYDMHHLMGNHAAVSSFEIKELRRRLVLISRRGLTRYDSG